MEESWIKTYWRPAIAWQYFAVCIFDFIIFPMFDFGLSYYLKIAILKINIGQTNGVFMVWG